MAENASKGPLLFREVNERIRELHAGFRVAGETLELVCECARIECTQVVEVPADVYERVRADRSRFVVAPGHEPAAGGHVLSAEATHRIVVASLTPAVGGIGGPAAAGLAPG